ncbi:Protein of unknown function [Gryllus bimaculatus]|nr:Protein of unknown function [Gryllus bimaculatus]
MAGVRRACATMPLRRRRLLVAAAGWFACVLMVTVQCDEHVVGDGDALDPLDTSSPSADGDTPRGRRSYGDSTGELLRFPSPVCRTLHSCSGEFQRKLLACFVFLQKRQFFYELCLYCTFKNTFSPSLIEFFVPIIPILLTPFHFTGVIVLYAVTLEPSSLKLLTTLFHFERILILFSRTNSQIYQSVLESNYFHLFTRLIDEKFCFSLNDKNCHTKLFKKIKSSGLNF